MVIYYDFGLPNKSLQILDMDVGEHHILKVKVGELPLSNANFKKMLIRIGIKIL